MADATRAARWTSNDGMVAKDIIVVGASAGGIEPVLALVKALPVDLQAAIFITVHTFDRTRSVLVDLLNGAGSLPAITPWLETPIEMGRIYVAPPDYHLILGKESISLSHGPKENLQRPCINVMFRSAAAAHGDRVAGVVLSGLLDGGSAGLWEIQQQGGVAIVQEPAEAMYPDMPENAIRALSVQYIVPVAEMAGLLGRLSVGERSSVEPRPPESARGELVTQACPQCGGAMTRYAKGRMHEFVCHIGHRFGLMTMIAEKSHAVETMIEGALAQSEELSDLLEEALPNLQGESARKIREEIARRRQEQAALRRVTEKEIKAPLD